LTFAPVLNALVRQSPMTWLELHGEVIDQKKQTLRKPNLKANFIQLKEEEILEWMEANGYPGRLIKLKGRRQGSSTGSLARAAHRCRKKPTGVLICGLDYGKNCKVMKRIFDHFVETDSFDWGITADRKIETTTFSNGSSVELLSANTGNAARGEGYQFGLITEMAFYPDTEKRSADDFIQAVLQCFPREPGTEVIIESTPNGEGGKYHTTWLGAISFERLKLGDSPENWNGFVKLFYPWHEHPDYTRPYSEQERDKIFATLSPREKELIEEFPHVDAGRLKWRREVISGIDFDGDEDKFEIEYPSDEHRCFAGTGRRRFDSRALERMANEATPGQFGTCEWANEREEHATFIPSGEESAWLRLWEKPKHMCKYSLIVDPMTGEQANGADPDSHAPIVMRDQFVDSNGRLWPPAVVARLADCWEEMRAKTPWSPQCRWHLDILEERVARVAAYFGWCQIVVEMNKDLGLVELLKRRPKAKLYQREEFNRKEDKVLEVYGWMTTPGGQGMRRAILESLSVRIRKHDEPENGLKLYDRRMIFELQRMIVKESGREEAGLGAHDDTVMALAIGLATLGKATTYYANVPNAGLYPWRQKGRGGNAATGMD